VPVILAGDYNVMPAEIDAYKPEGWVDDALLERDDAWGNFAWLVLEKISTR
jgi:exonuclease III